MSRAQLQSYQENPSRNAEVELAQPYALHHVSHHSKVFVKVSMVTSWLTAWESFPFVQFPRGEKMELLSYSSIRQIWMEGIELSPQRVPKSTMLFKKHMESYSKKAEPWISQTDAYHIPPHRNIAARTLSLNS